MEYVTIGRNVHPGYRLSLVCGEGYEIGAGALPFRLIWIEKGAGLIRVNKDELFCTAPALLCLNEEEYLETSGSADFQIRTAYFEPFIINNKFNYKNIRENEADFSQTEAQDRYLICPFIKRDQSYMGFIGVDPGYYQQITGLMISIQQELAAQRDASWPCRSRSYLFQLLILVTKLFEDQEKKGYEVAQEQTSDIISQVIQYLKTHYHERITVDSLARQFSMNRTTLNSEFSKLTSLSVIDYVIKLRIHLASVLLRDTLLSVAEICDRTGFTNTTHFWRMFKKLTGASPSDYRNKHCWLKTS
ncbi:MAG: AraC family transcriptional regulator [Clostridia bacterium]|nr:AraC family transcriptional regulator [Clostridia bacterium]